ncbi:MAG: hypothetical protein ACRDHG_02215 [Anaerolineales bacterium]
MTSLSNLQAELAKANQEFEAAVENDDPKAGQLLDRVTELEGLLQSQLNGAPAAPVISAAAIGLEPVVRKEAPQMAGLSITKGQLGIKAFESVLGALSPADISQLLVPVTDTEDLLALVLPGVSKITAENRSHLTQRGDVKRAARGLAIAAAGGVDLDARLITSASGSEYTIEDGVCYELRSTEQPDFSGNVAILSQKVACKGHLGYDRVDGKFVPTGESLLRCKHQWALMFALGYFVTASKSVFETVARTEIGNSVGDAAARAAAGAQISEWSNNREARQEVRTVFAQAIAHEKNMGNVGPDGLLPAKTEIGGYQLPSGKTVAQAVADLRGRMFALKMELPMRDNGTVEVVTRTVKNMAELASAVAPHFAVANQNEGTLKVLDLIAR